MNYQTKHSWDWFKDKVRSATGLDLMQYKSNQLDRRLESMATRAKMETPEAFWLWLQEDESRMRPFLDSISINVSELLRNPEKFEQLQEKVLPELLKERPALKVWSAGCSYGAEAYSVAMLLAEIAPGQSHRIVGTDIDHGILAKARAAHFAEDGMKNVSPERKTRHFNLVDGKYVPKAELQTMVAFQGQDLLRDRYPGGFDLICCRNVVIYFTDDAKEQIYRRFMEALRPGGYLFVGSTERIVSSRDLGYESPYPFFYRRPTMGGSQWQHAS